MEELNFLAMAELERSLLEQSVAQGNLGMVLEHAADAGVTVEELRKLLAEAINVNASKWEEAAERLGPPQKAVNVWGVELSFGGGEFEKRRAKGLRKLAKLILRL